MADEDFGDLNLSQYGGSGRWLQSSNPSWVSRSGPNPSPQHNHIPGRYSVSQRGSSYEAEDVANPYNRGPGSTQQRGRSGLYYSPPGTSYTIVERPVATTAITQPHSGVKTNRSYVGSSHSQPHSHSHTPRTAPNSAGKKRPMSPEEVLKLFGPGAGKGSNFGRRSQSPASSPPSTTHHQYLYQNTHDDLVVRTVTMVRPPDAPHGFGICVKGGKDSDPDGVGVYISRVEEGSVAERVGLRPGDSILEVNGTPFTQITHEEALKMLKSCRKLSMTVRSPNLPPQPLPIAPPTPLTTGGPWLVRQTYSWMDRQGRPVSPPLEYARAAPPMIVTPRWSYAPRSKEKGGTRKVDLNIEPGQSLGLMIRGGLEYNLGIFITGVDKDSVADRAGLMVGDQILEVNGQSFLDVTHDEAVNQLKIHKRMTLIVRDVGKVPHSCTAYDDYVWEPCTTRDERLFSGKGCCPTLQMIEEKAKVLLNRNELNTLAYYQEEYTARQMTIEAFVTVLLELLNTPEKHTLLTELREVVLPEDRARFDELVYRRDHYGHRRKGCDNSHVLMSNLHDLPGSELAHKLSRSFDMKEDQELLESSGGNMRRHQSMQKLSRADIGDPQGDDDGLMGAMVVPDQQGNLRITVSKTKPILGIAIEGGANTKHPLPRIINIHENGAAFEAGGLEVGQLILEVDGQKVEGMHHQDIARLIAESFARRERHEIEFLVVEAKKSNLEPKPTALIFLEA